MAMMLMKIYDSTKAATKAAMATTIIVVDVPHIHTKHTDGFDKL